MKATFNAQTGLDLSPSCIQDATLLDRVALATAKAEVEGRRYILSTNRTPGLNYDDRLPQRLGIGKTKAYELVNSGELRSRKIAGKHVVSESAVRRFLDPEAYAAPVDSSDAQAA
ncbi:helix-turn-helix domain-containing protein [Hymenobacter sp. 15J16-1T3B]|uniref:helix-turn-helix domain-containing protein n=1 Tax=Hymenobacter sp. 15J16-1T3B TaxID=2886941 RepID=UPI001D11E350|nr:helix-turn-helix domain-containing protein [Hymenobacter sp. 15J16-1T3B]MCC3159480.1 helix-turn-helix domain-containing protein [Hymenobacter sp. 15J16-1T3B]